MCPVICKQNSVKYYECIISHTYRVHLQYERNIMTEFVLKGNFLRFISISNKYVTKKKKIPISIIFLINLT